MKIIYWIKRHARSLVRSIFNNQIPEWLSDLYGAVAYVNFINLIPTLCAILTVPEHFFRRVDRLVHKRKSGLKESLYKSPVQLITSIATLIWTTKWIGAYVPVGKQKEILAGILISLPVLIPLLCLVLLVVGRVSLFVVTHGVTALLVLGWLPKRVKVRAILQCQQGFRYLCVPLSWSIYSLVDWGKMFWSTLYFYGYLISFPVFISVFSGFGVLLLFRESLEGKALWQLLVHFNGSDLWGSAVLVGSVTILYGRLIIYPYAVALLQSMKKPTILIRQIEMHRYVLHSELLFQSLSRHFKLLEKKNLSDDERQKIALRVRDNVLKELTSFRKKWDCLKSQQQQWHKRFKIHGDDCDRENERLFESHAGLRAIYEQLVEGPLSQDQVDLLEACLKAE